MERLVGIALSRYLSHYIKDYSADKFQNWTLHDLEFKSDVLQQLVGIPPNFTISKATCNKVYAKIPWTSLGHDPIVFVADTIFLELEEPSVIKPMKPLIFSHQTQQGWIDRVLDNIKFEVTELKLKIQTLGKKSRRKKPKPPAINIHIKDIQMYSTNSQWEIADLTVLHKVNTKGEVLLYKEVHVGSCQMTIDTKAMSFPLLSQVPVIIRLKSKKEFFGGPTVEFEFDLDVPELNIKFTHQEFKMTQRMFDAMLECMYRTPDKKRVVKADETGQLTTTLTYATDHVVEEVPETTAAVPAAPEAAADAVCTFPPIYTC